MVKVVDAFLKLFVITFKDIQVTHIMLELGKWNKAEHEVKTDLDKLILLMEFTDTATAQDPITKA